MDAQKIERLQIFKYDKTRIPDVISFLLFHYGCVTEQASFCGNNFAETIVKSGIPGDRSMKTLARLLFRSNVFDAKNFLIDE